MSNEKSKFHIKAHHIAQDEMSASFFEDRGNVALDKLYAEYVEAGSPQNIEDWLRNRLKDFFKCANVRPVWRSDFPIWPFLNNEPMVFIHQNDTPRIEISERHIVPPSTLYVFGGAVTAPDDADDNWTMEYQVVSEFNDPGDDDESDDDELFDGIPESEIRASRYFTGNAVPPEGLFPTEGTFEERFPILAKLIPGLFYPGYESALHWEDFEGPAYALAAISFLADNSRRVITNAYGELRSFISLSLPEEELKEVMTKSFGCTWNPASEDMTYEEFLDNVVSIWEEWIDEADGVS